MGRCSKKRSANLRYAKQRKNVPLPLSERLAEPFRGQIRSGEIPALTTSNTVELHADQAKDEMILVRLDFPVPGHYHLRAIVDDQQGIETTYTVLVSDDDPK